MIEFTLTKEFPIIESVIVEEDWNIFDKKRSIATSEYYNFYYSYANSWKPKSILEIGVRRGYSAVSMLIGSGDCLQRFVGIDSEVDLPSSSKFAQDILRSHTNAEIKLINIDTQNSYIPDEIGIFDLIHIDADHTFHGCINDVLLALSLSKPGTKIVVDDCLYAPVRAAVEVIAKIYDIDLELKYVTNFRGHGLIQTLRSFPELANKQARKEIINQQESPLPIIQVSSITNNYSPIRRQAENYYIQNKNLSYEFLDAISPMINQCDLYVKEAVQKINFALKFYQDNGFYLEEIFSAVNLIESEVSSENIDNISFSVNKMLINEGRYNPKDIKVCNKIYARLYLLNQFRLKLVANPVGKCFSYLCGELEKHFDYLAARISKTYNSSHLPSQLPGLEDYMQNSASNFLTHEDYLFLTVLTDALINVVSCFECEIESQYWMRYWDIKNNETWKKLVIPIEDIYHSPIPFPVKSKTEYDNYYKLQNTGSSGGVSVTNYETLDNYSYSALNPTDHAFRFCTTISHIQLLLQLLQERHPLEQLRWLDVGCGIGNIANRVKFDGTVVGIDVADSLIEYANATRLTDNHKFITGNLTDARTVIGGEKFHLITANELVEHIFDPLEFISELSCHTCDLIYASSPLNEKVPYEPAREHLWSFNLDAYTSLFKSAGMTITFSGTMQVGKYIGEGHNWLSVCATNKHPFRVFPLS